MISTGKYLSPLGEITMAGSTEGKSKDGGALVGLWFEGQKFFGGALLHCAEEDDSLPIFARTRNWLNAYFRGNAPDFLPQVKLLGTPFQISVWKRLQKIPYGQTRTYGEIAAEIARERGVEKCSARAVGQAIGRNPVSIVVPCHRVVGRGGNATGYAGGIARKLALLRLEGAR